MKKLTTMYYVYGTDGDASLPVRPANAQLAGIDPWTFYNSYNDRDAAAVAAKKATALWAHTVIKPVREVKFV